MIKIYESFLILKQLWMDFFEGNISQFKKIVFYSKL